MPLPALLRIRSTQVSAPDTRHGMRLLCAERRSLMPCVVCLCGITAVAAADAEPTLVQRIRAVEQDIREAKARIQRAEDAGAKWNDPALTALVEDKKALQEKENLLLRQQLAGTGAAASSAGPRSLSPPSYLQQPATDEQRASKQRRMLTMRCVVCVACWVCVGVPSCLSP